MEPPLVILLVGLLALGSSVRLATAGPAPGLRLEVVPHRVYAADDGVAPRWRFSAVAINSSHDTFTLRQVTTTLVGPSGRRSQVQAGSRIRGITQGQRTLPPDEVVVLELKDSGRDPLPAAALLEWGFTGPQGKPVLLTKRVPLVPRPTLYLRFPLPGHWVAVNGREMMHSIGRQFAFDFIALADLPLHESGSGRTFTCADFSSYGQPLLSPAAGQVVACEGGRPDEVPTPGHASYGTQQPAGGWQVYLGNYLLLRLDGGEHLLLVHCRAGSLQVKVGNRVREAQPLAQVGNSGNTSGPHLHIELLDTRPNLSQMAELELRASGVPFGFKQVRCERKGGRPAQGDLVPRGSNIVTALADR